MEELLDARCRSLWRYEGTGEIRLCVGVHEQDAFAEFLQCGRQQPACVSLAQATLEIELGTGAKKARLFVTFVSRYASDLK